MKKDGSRIRRVEDQLQRELAQLIQRGLKDPRLGMITVTAVEVTKEMEHAIVFVTELGGDEQTHKESLKILNGAAGFLRREVGRCLTLRHVPEIRFKYDASVESGIRLSNLIDAARAADDQRHLDAPADEPDAKT
jgi:ribosome-binding factor A